ncbi:murein hydrolase activator EnvC family protein [Kistimonas asteriae]|uniref:murein hydrolase activator EnvC family protein n=1 Tax=Kistimonas asteriae TaxID=517724 RepID=UPI001BAA3977|nr:peptidoglycan DD-metalloendopeptidase family protein [Kistimonas asteriae]
MKKLTIPVMLALALCSLSITLPARAEAPAEDKSRQLEAVKADIKKLEKTLKGIRKERSSLERSLQTNEKAIGNLHREIRALEQRLREGRAELKKFSSQRQGLMKEKEAGLQALTVSLRSAYVSGQDSPLKLLLNQEDPSAVTRLLTYQRYYSDAQQAVVDDLRNTIGRLATTEDSLATANQRLEDNHNQLASRRDRLTSSNRERQQLLAKLKREESGKGQRLNKLAQQQKELEQLIAAILDMEASASFDRPFTEARGKLPWPVKGRVKHRFGQHRADSTIPWNGLFIEVAQATTVKAPWHGQVIFADWLKGFGLLVILNHGNNYMTLYAHNQALLRNVGDWVSAGDDIAETGATGGNNDMGLYFELRKNGKPINPSQWLVR